MRIIETLKQTIFTSLLYRGEKQKAYDTRDSQAVSDPSTNRAQRCLTWQIGRDAVFSTWYGRKRVLVG
jgi:hypothetical protein